MVSTRECLESLWTLYDECHSKKMLKEVSIMLRWFSPGGMNLKRCISASKQVHFQLNHGRLSAYSEKVVDFFEAIQKLRKKELNGGGESDI
jgi:hypothetical protein